MPECYGQMTHMLKGLANGRIILVLEVYERERGEERGF